MLLLKILTRFVILLRISLRKLNKSKMFFLNRINKSLNQLLVKIKANLYKNALKNLLINFTIYNIA